MLPVETSSPSAKKRKLTESGQPIEELMKSSKGTSHLKQNNLSITTCLNMKLTTTSVTIESGRVGPVVYGEQTVGNGVRRETAPQVL